MSGSEDALPTHQGPSPAQPLLPPGLEVVKPQSVQEEIVEEQAAVFEAVFKDEPVGLKPEALDTIYIPAEPSEEDQGFLLEVVMNEEPVIESYALADYVGQPLELVGEELWFSSDAQGGGQEQPGEFTIVEMRDERSGGESNEPKLLCGRSYTCISAGADRDAMEYSEDLELAQAWIEYEQPCKEDFEAEERLILDNASTESASSTAAAGVPTTSPQPQPRRRRANASSTAKPVRARSQSRSRSHGCPQCGKDFASCTHLDQHQMTHSGERPHTCPQCGHRFGLLHNLQKHIQVVHAGEKPYICPHCERRFGYLDVLKNHIRTHTGERPFCCGECGQRFSRQSILITHRRTHTGEQPFICGECGRRFSDASGLRRHRTMHTVKHHFQCPECVRCFRRQANLIKHMRVHIGKQSPISCKECGCWISNNSDLNKHQCVLHAKSK